MKRTIVSSIAGAAIGGAVLGTLLSAPLAQALPLQQYVFWLGGGEDVTIKAGHDGSNPCTAKKLHIERLTNSVGVSVSCPVKR